MAKGSTYRKFTSIRKFKKANKLKNMGKDFVYETLKEQKDWNRRLSCEFHYNKEELEKAILMAVF